MINFNASKDVLNQDIMRTLFIIYVITVIFNVNNVVLKQITVLVA